MNIYRLEFTDGEGVYHTSGHSLRPLLEPEEQKPEALVNQPMPQNDKTLVEHILSKFAKPRPFRMSDKEVEISIFTDAWFGFDSIKQLFHWFWERDVLEKMSAYHVLVVEYNIPDDAVITGDTQCLIEPSFKTPKNVVKSWPIQEFLTIYGK